MSAKKKKPLDNYSLSIFFAAMAGIVLSMLAVTAALALSPELSALLIDVIYAIYTLRFTSQLVSGNGYFFTLVDKLWQKKTPLEPLLPKNPQESRRTFRANLAHLFTTKKDAQFIGLLIGLLATISITAITLTTNLILAPAIQLFPPIINGIILVVGNLSLFCGLGGRLGQTVDYFRRPQQNAGLFQKKRVNYILAILIGVCIGVVSAALLATLVLTLPFTLNTIVFVITITSIAASASGYIGRLFDVWFGDKTFVGFFISTATNAADNQKAQSENSQKPNPEIEVLLSQNAIGKKPLSFKERIRKKESSGTFIGVSLGIAAAIFLSFNPGIVAVIFAFLLPVMPALSALPLALAIILIAACLISAFGGLGNRIGHMIDTFDTFATAVAAGVKASEPKAEIPKPPGNSAKNPDAETIPAPVTSTSKHNQEKGEATTSANLQLPVSTATPSQSNSGDPGKNESQPLPMSTNSRTLFAIKKDGSSSSTTSQHTATTAHWYTIIL